MVELTPRRTRVIVAVALVTAAAAGCGASSSGSASAPQAPASTRAATPSTIASSAPSSASTTSSRIEADLTEFHIALSRTSFAPGTYTFMARNGGDDTHALQFDGPGVDDKSSGLLRPGQSRPVTVTLAKGTYDVYCPVANHKMLGMNLHITVR